MTKARFSQFGTVSVAIMLPVTMLCVYLAYRIPVHAAGEAFPLLAVAVVIFFIPDHFGYASPTPAKTDHIISFT